MRFVVLLGLFAITALAGPAASEPVPLRLAADTEDRWVTFDLTPGNQIRFRMTVNGQSATAILDTGVSYTVASSAFAARLGLRPAAAGRAQAIGGSVPLSWAQVETMGIGGLSRTGGKVAVSDLKAVATGSAEPVEMLVGADVLAAQALDIDYDARRFRLLPSGRMPFRGTTAPLGTSRESGVFTSEVTIGGRRLRPMIVDTGDGAAITLSHEVMAAGTPVPGKVTSSFAYGLGGAIEMDLTIAPAIGVGPLIARNVELYIERGGGFSQQTGTAGRIGSGFLQRYRVLMDVPARRMILTPGRTADKMPLKSTSGLLIGFQKEAARNSLRVLHVMKNSPAAAAGWRAGETICQVDGVTVTNDYMGSPLSRWTAGAPGRGVALTLCDASASRTLTLTNFY